MILKLKFVPIIYVLKIGNRTYIVLSTIQALRIIKNIILEYTVIYSSLKIGRYPMQGPGGVLGRDEAEFRLRGRGVDRYNWPRK